MEPIAPAPRIANALLEPMGAPTIAPFARCMAGDAEIALVRMGGGCQAKARPTGKRFHESRRYSSGVCADLPHQSVSRNDRAALQRGFGRIAGDRHARAGETYER